MAAVPEDNEKDLEDAAARAFTTLGQILKMARMQKARRAKEEALKEAGIDPTKVNLDDLEEDFDIDSKF